MKGVDVVPITTGLMTKADALVLALEQRFDIHIDNRVDKVHQHHSTLRFTHNNLLPMAAAMFVAGHIVNSINL